MGSGGILGKRWQQVAVSVLTFVGAASACSSEQAPNAPDSEFDDRTIEVYEGIFGEGPNPFPDADAVFEQCIDAANLPEREDDSLDPEADRQTAFACTETAFGESRAVDDALSPFFVQLAILTDQSLERAGIDPAAASVDERRRASNEVFTDFQTDNREEVLAAIQGALDRN